MPRRHTGSALAAVLLATAASVVAVAPAAAAASAPVGGPAKLASPVRPTARIDCSSQWWHVFIPAKGLCIIAQWANGDEPDPEGEDGPTEHV